VTITIDQSNSTRLLVCIGLGDTEVMCEKPEATPWYFVTVDPPGPWMLRYIFRCQIMARYECSAWCIAQGHSLQVGWTGRNVRERAEIYFHWREGSYFAVGIKGFLLSQPFVWIQLQTYSTIQRYSALLTPILLSLQAAILLVWECTHNPKYDTVHLFYIQSKVKTPWPESASEQHRPSDRRLSAKLVQTFADRG
jgi:hypothetical protein